MCSVYVQNLESHKNNNKKLGDIYGITSNRNNTLVQAFFKKHMIKCINENKLGLGLKKRCP